jgi:hypothetical protein
VKALQVAVFAKDSDYLHTGLNSGHIVECGPMWDTGNSVLLMSSDFLLYCNFHSTFSWNVVLVHVTWIIRCTIPAVEPHRLAKQFSTSSHSFIYSSICTQFSSNVLYYAVSCLCSHGTADGSVRDLMNMVASKATERSRHRWGWRPEMNSENTHSINYSHECNNVYHVFLFYKQTLI